MFHKLFFLSLIISIMACSSVNNNQISGFSEPADPDEVDVSLWDTVDKGLMGSFGSTDIAYGKSVPPYQKLSESIRLSGWRGERIHAQMLLWSKYDIGDICLDMGVVPDHPGIIRSDIQTRIVKYVLSDEFINGCGYRDKDTIPAHISPDMLDPSNSFPLNGMETRPVWLSIDIPQNCHPGLYSCTAIAYSASDTVNLAFEIEVPDKILPPPAEWLFHLDLWQNPYAVARYHGVELWSQEHIDLLRPLLLLLADAGQKCITTTLNNKPWGGQTYDPFGAMINWIRNSNDQWEYDYSVFDQYVDLAMECGIDKQINCYSMVPWGNRFSWFDEDSARYVTVEAIPGTTEYEDIWKPFLNDFKVHLMERGWLELTTIAMDERKPEDMKKIISLAKKCVPEIKITLAGNIMQPEIDSSLYDLSIAIGLNPDSENVKARVASGKPTTFYTCCAHPEHPNNFTFSPPADNTFIGWYAAAWGYSGFLRWAYNSWVEDPVMDSRFRAWPSGDTYFVYPGARSSVRFEKLREGIQDYEKINILLKELAMDPSDEAAAAELRINRFLDNINIETLNNRSA
ncbi:MAG: DUF4091 domain-containing protein, partial [Bacteroidales bacterium]|nr:DUF4091 domain-containing protein [Bacteroidales bacterium]